MIAKSPGSEARTLAAREEDQELAEAKLPLMREEESPVEHLAADPFAAGAELLDGGPRGEVLAPCVLPVEFTATLSEHFKPGEAFTIQGPLGPIKVEPPEDAEPGTTLRYRLAPQPDFRVRVPEGARPGSAVRFPRADGVEVSVAVPDGMSPGDIFDVTPPALMVKVPEGASAGDLIAFRYPAPPEAPAPWFRAPLPEGLEPGRYFTAKLPVPKTRPPAGHPQLQSWWKAQASELKAMAREPLDFLKALRKPGFERRPAAAAAAE